ncbi:MAG: zinc-binding alcohol dehydrogenase [Clostridia bacterium]|nr:zinc-binding alcohol dehydrogenase [Clostridia bacterium]
MKNANIIFTEPYVAKLIEKEIGHPGAGEVLVRSVRDTISSGTERANFIGDANINSTKAPGVSFPRQNGYSIAGIVEEVGEGVKSVSVGDRVACSWTKHAKYNILKEEKVYRLDPSIGFDAGALVHIATFPLAAVRKCKLEIGESAIVMGLGVLGLISVKLLRAAGAVPIIACDPIEEKRQQALSIGADYALDPFDPEFSKKAKELTNGGAKVAIEVTGKGSGLDGALDCMAPFGRVALLGCTRDSDFSIDYYRKVHGRGVTLIGAHTQARPKKDSFDGWWSERDDALSIIEMLGYGRLTLADLVGEVHSPCEAQEIFTRLASDRSFPVVQFDWEVFDQK